MVKVVKSCNSCGCLFVCSMQKEECKEAHVCVCIDCLSHHKEGCNIRIIRSGIESKEDTL